MWSSVDSQGQTGAASCVDAGELGSRCVKGGLWVLPRLAAHVRAGSQDS